MLKIHSKLSVAAVSLSMLGFSGSVLAAACGPGPHWVDDCPAGTDELKNSVAVITIKDGPCDVKGGKKRTIVLKGPAIIEREAGQPHKIDVEMVSMVLTDKSGTITLRAGTDEGVTPPSLGEIVEQAGDPTKADSYFNVFFVIEGTPWGRLHNKDKEGDFHIMRGVITEVPPEDYLYLPPPDDVTPMYNDDDEEVACLIKVKHPVTFTHPLTATTLGNSNVVDLTWSTGYEEYMAGFAVYRGVLADPAGACTDDVEDYTSITMVDWVDSQGGGDYSLIDPQGDSSLCYGLLAAGFDGTFEIQTTDVQ